ncbi:hypothetical protein P3S67_032270 [Capsicum chacoense]
MICIVGWIDLLDGYSDLWGYRHGRLVLPVRGAVLRDYALWFLKHGQLLIGNPALKYEQILWLFRTLSHMAQHPG